jgi:hypothetical protein
MVEGEHTIIGKIPRERLNQIAARKLSTLGVPVRLAGDRETLEGELTFGGRLVHPVTGQPVLRGRFVVSGHDRLRFLDPPLSAVGPIDFYVHDRLASLEQAIAAAMGAIHGQLQEVAARLRALRLEANLDPERLLVRAVVKTPAHAFEVLGGADGVRISRVAPVGGKPWEVSADFPLLQLGDFQTLGDLELWLVDAQPRMRPSAAAPHVPEGAPAGRILEVTPPPRNALTLKALAEVFGDDAMLPPNAMVELVQEFQHGGTRYRFVAAREMGTRFKGRLIGPSGDVWSEKFDLASFPGTRKVVAAALGAEEETPADHPLADHLAAAPGRAVPDHLQPMAGEIWVMSVVVEEAGPDEVRYVGTDIDGRPYGAARVLAKADFEAVFSKEKGGWRLLIVIDQAQEGAVLYRQLDHARQPMGAPRKMAAAILVANFVPESQAY